MKRKKLAFIVEDEELSIKHYEHLLVDLGFEIRKLRTEKETLKALSGESPHVAFVHFTEDVHRTMRFISKLSRRDPTISIIYCTFFDGLSLFKKAIDSGACVVMPKRDTFGGKLRDEVMRAYKRSLDKKTNIRGSQVFVLMPFAKRFDEIYRLAIKEPLERIGHTCQRVDEIQFTGNIMDEVYKGIRAASLVVADMTGRNPNVFYEVGYAHALDKTVILVTQKVDDIPFDLRSQRHIVYGRSIVRLRDELIKTVQTLRSK